MGGRGLRVHRVLFLDRRGNDLARHSRSRIPRSTADCLQPQEARPGTGSGLLFVSPVLREGDVFGSPGRGHLLRLPSGSAGKKQGGGEARPASSVRSSSAVDRSLPPACACLLFPPQACRGRQDRVRSLSRLDRGDDGAAARRQASPDAGLPGLSPAFGHHDRLHGLPQMRAPAGRREKTP